LITQPENTLNLSKVFQSNTRCCLRCAAGFRSDKDILPVPGGTPYATAIPGNNVTSVTCRPAPNEVITPMLEPGDAVLGVFLYLHQWWRTPWQ
jgi:hypothetical protein